MNKEIWEQLPYYGWRYYISSIGRVKSISHPLYETHHKHPPKERILAIELSKAGYAVVCLMNNNKRYTVKVHRLVAIAFIPNPKNKPQVNHLNGIKTDNRVENLEWCTMSENHRHSFRVLGRTGNFLNKFGKDNPFSVPIEQYSMDDIFIREFAGIADAGRILNVDSSTICRCCKGQYKKAYGSLWRYKNTNRN